jgi:lycopene cyclase domain-containing protein
VAEYTVAAAASVVIVVLLELVVLRNGLFRRPAYWVTMGIVGAFQIPVDGWLTKLSAPIVTYGPAYNTGVRFPLDIPVEDFLFGFALVTLTLSLWVRLGRRPARPEPRSRPLTSVRSERGPGG